MILVIRLLDMAGLRMHVLPAAIDWNASLQLPVGLFGVGLEGADVCFASSRRPVFVFTRNEPHNRTINIVISSGEGDVAWARLWGFAAYRS